MGPPQAHPQLTQLPGTATNGARLCRHWTVHSVQRALQSGGRWSPRLTQLLSVAPGLAPCPGLSGPLPLGVLACLLSLPSHVPTDAKTSGVGKQPLIIPLFLKKKIFVIGHWLQNFKGQELDTFVLSSYVICPGVSERMFHIRSYE